MSVKVNYQAQCTVVETLETSIAGLDPGDKTVTHSTFNSQATMDSNTTPPVTKVVSFEPTLSAGALTIDLTALVGVNGAAVDGTGLKVQVFKIKNKAGNAALTVKFGAATPYNLLGASWTLILLAGQEITIYGNDATPDVAAGAKNIDLSGTGVEEAECVIVLG